jgi:hypothetical protein
VKNYIKPSLEALGLLRDLTKFSGGDPSGGGPNGGGSNGGGSNGGDPNIGKWGDGHAFSVF